MNIIKVRNVGSGLSISVKFNHKTLQIDCGSKQKRFNSNVFDDLYRMNAFVLSHFHDDHYNGIVELLEENMDINTSIDELYYPKMPTIINNDSKLSEELYLCETTAKIVLGKGSGSMEVDLIELFENVNQKNKTFKCIPLSKGDIINFDNEQLTVLWPPLELNISENDLKKIKRIINTFIEALKKDDDLFNIYENLKPQIKIENHNNPKEGKGKGERKNRKELFQKIGKENKKLSKELLDAIDELLSIQNDLSLVLKQGNNFLFMGDLDKKIETVVNEFIGSNEIHYYNVLIPPHHGTHWDNSLNRIHSNYCISSVGENLFCKYKKELDINTQNTRITQVDHDVIISLNIRDISNYRYVNSNRIEEILKCDCLHCRHYW